MHMYSWTSYPGCENSSKRKSTDDEMMKFSNVNFSAIRQNLLENEQSLKIFGVPFALIDRAIPEKTHR